MIEVLELVHTCSPTTEVILCAIPPRGLDRRPWIRKWKGQLRHKQQWIDEANNVLKAILHHKEHVRFLDVNLVYIIYFSLILLLFSSPEHECAQGELL